MTRLPTVGSMVIVTAAAGLLTACSASVTTQPAPATSAAEPTATTTAAVPTESAQPADLSDPCTLLTADEINAALGTSFDPATPTADDTRQIVTCKYAADDMTAIVDIGVSQIDGAESFDTNHDLAPAYFGGKARTIEVPGAEKAYLVIAETFDSPVIGMLVNGSFVLLQVGVEGTTPEQAEPLAALVAAKVP